MDPELELARNDDALSNPTGPYNIGTIELAFEDDSRVDVYRNAGPRKLLVQFWYPSEDPGTGEWANYMHPTVVELFSLFQDYVDPGTMTTFVGNLGTNAIPSASISSLTGKLPVVFFSHGFLGTKNLYTSYIEELASQGYLVVGIDHTFGAFASVFPDGQLVLASATQPSFPEIVAIWAADVSYVLDLMEGGLLEDGIGLSTSADLENVSMIGHSTGGTTIGDLLVSDPRIDRGISLDAPQAGLALNHTINKPLFLFFDDESIYFDTMIQDNLTGPGFELTIDETSHYSFTDLPLMIKRAEIPQDTLGTWERHPGFIDGDRNLEIHNRYFNAFLDSYARGNSDDLLAGPSADFPDVNFRVLNQGSGAVSGGTARIDNPPSILANPGQ